MTRHIITYISVLLLFVAGGCSHGAATHADGGHGHVHGTEEEKSPDIEVTATQMKTAGIELGAVSRRSIGDAVRANGEIAVSPQQIADVAPMVAGIVKRIKVVEGQRVRAGQTVAFIENGEVVTLQQDYLTAVDEAALAAKELARQEALAEQGAGIARNLQQARTADKVARLRVGALLTRLNQLGVSVGGNVDSFSTCMAVKAPVSGTVTSVAVTTGVYADPSQPMMTIVDNSGVYARLNIFEKDLARVKVGQHVEMRLTNTGETVTGTVAEITPALDAASRAAAVRVSIGDSAAAQLMPGMALTAFISLGADTTDAVPESALAVIEGKNYLFVLRGIHTEADGTKSYAFHRTPVEVGVREGGWVAVSFPQPIATDAKIVTDNVFYLASMTADHGEHNH